jgi:hypothetical protein
MIIAGETLGAVQVGTTLENAKSRDIANLGIRTVLGLVAALLHAS